MSRVQDEKHIRYVTAWLDAFSNVWWSAANEYDLFRSGYKAKKSEWQRILRCIRENDPYGHMLGIHQCLRHYDHRDKNLTHCSLQRTGMYVSTGLTGEMQARYKKPVVWDEINYEGDIKPTFSNCTPQELVRHFWEAAVRAGFAEHGETYTDPDNILWWAKGGRLHGESPARIRFLKEIMADYGNPRLTCCQSGEQLPVGMEEDELFIWYFGSTQSAAQDIVLPSRHGYQIEIVDTWSMERRILDGEYQGVCEVPLEGKPYMAVFARKIRAPRCRRNSIRTASCGISDIIPAEKNIYRLLKKTPLLGGNTFVLYDSLRHLQTMAGDVVTERMIEALCGYANDGKLLHHLFGMLKKE